MSRLSFSVKEGAEIPTPGRLIPLFSLRNPPFLTRQRTVGFFTDSTMRRIKPSSRRIVSPGWTSAAKFGYVVLTSSAVPWQASVVIQKVSPALSSTAVPPFNFPTRSLGPCKSSKMATGRLWVREMERIVRMASE